MFCILGGSSALDLPSCGGTPVWWNPPSFSVDSRVSKERRRRFLKTKSDCTESFTVFFLACESLLWWGTAQSSFVEPLVEPPTKIPFGGTLYVTGVLPIIVGRHMSQVRCDWWNPCHCQLVEPPVTRLLLTRTVTEPPIPLLVEPPALLDQFVCVGLPNWWNPWLPVD